jgi:hypothetical protein
MPLIQSRAFFFKKLQSTGFYSVFTSEKQKTPMPKLKAKPNRKENGILVISKETYLSLFPLYQMAAQALQKTGKVKILYNDPKYKDL